MSAKRRILHRRGRGAGQEERTTRAATSAATRRRMSSARSHSRTLGSISTKTLRL